MRIRKTVGFAGFSLAVVVATQVLGISPASAAGTSIQTSWGFGAVTAVQGPNGAGWLKYGGLVKDQACDSHEVRLYVNTYATGGVELTSDQVYYTDNQGCSTSISYSETYSPSQLQGYRSGYLDIKLCKHAGVAITDCTYSSLSWSV